MHVGHRVSFPQWPSTFLLQPIQWNCLERARLKRPPCWERPFCNLWKNTIYHWITCKLKLSGKTTCLKRLFFLDIKGGRFRQVSLYQKACWMGSKTLLNHIHLQMIRISTLEDNYYLNYFNNDDRSVGLCPFDRRQNSKNKSTSRHGIICQTSREEVRKSVGKFQMPIANSSCWSWG